MLFSAPPQGTTLLKRLLFDNSAGGFGLLLERVGQLKTRHGLSKAVFALEPTGNYHKPLANWLLEQGQLLVLVSNHAIAENRQTLDGRWDKNDTKDSANVADLVSQGKCQSFEEPDADLLESASALVIFMNSNINTSYFATWRNMVYIKSSIFFVKTVEVINRGRDLSK